MSSGEEGLGASASRGAAATAGGQVARLVVQMASIVVLGRLLTPADVGLIAMVTAIVGIGEVFRDFGLSSASIQAKSVSFAQRSNLFWVNTGIGLALFVLSSASAPLVAALYGQPQVGAIMVACAGTFVLNGVATQYRADLNRRLKFGWLAIIDTVAQVVSVAIAIVLAASGSGYWSLVAMTLAQALLSMVGVVVVGRWIPSLYQRSAEMRSFFKFGVGIAGSQLIGYASKNVDSVTLGLVAGPTAVGLYNRANQVLMIPLSQLQAPSTRVALPVLSRLSAQPARYDAFLLRGQTIVINAVALLLAVTAAQAEPLFAWALGPQWTDSVPVFQALAVGGLASMANYACYWVFLSKGLTLTHFFFSLLTRPFVILAIVLGAIWGGAVGVALAFSTVSLVLWPVTLFWLKKRSDAPVGDMFVNGARAFLIYSVAGGASWFASRLVSGSQVLSFATGVAAFVFVLGVFFLLVPRYRRDLRDIVDIRRFFRAGGGT